MLETDPIKNGTTKKASSSANETLNRNAASFVVMTGFNAAFFLFLRQMTGRPDGTLCRKRRGKKECAKEDERGRRERANNASTPVHPSRDSGEYFTQPCVLRNEFIAKNAGTHLFPILSFSFSLYSFLSRRVLRALVPSRPGTHAYYSTFS